MKYDISDFAVKAISVDDYNDVKFAVKLTVKNNTRDEDVYFDLQGLDEEGFEIETVSINCEVSPGGSRKISTHDEMSADLFEQIVEWQVK